MLSRQNLNELNEINVIKNQDIQKLKNKYISEDAKKPIIKPENLPKDIDEYIKNVDDLYIDVLNVKDNFLYDKKYEYETKGYNKYKVKDSILDIENEIFNIFQSMENEKMLVLELEEELSNLKKQGTAYKNKQLLIESKQDLIKRLTLRYEMLLNKKAMREEELKNIEDQARGLEGRQDANIFQFSELSKLQSFIQLKEDFLKFYKKLKKIDIKKNIFKIFNDQIVKNSINDKLQNITDILYNIQNLYSNIEIDNRDKIDVDKLILESINILQRQMDYVKFSDATTGVPSLLIGTGISKYKYI